MLPLIKPARINKICVFLGTNLTITYIQINKPRKPNKMDINPLGKFRKTDNRYSSPPKNLSVFLSKPYNNERNKFNGSLDQKRLK